MSWMPGFPVLHCLLEFAQTCVHSCHPAISSSVVPFSSCLQSFPALVFSFESALCIRWPKYWSFSISISPSNVYSGLIFFRVQFSHPYMTPGKTIALTRQTFVGKVTSVLFDMLSRFVIAFLPRSKCLLISWLPSPSTVILEPKKINLSPFPFFASTCHEVMRQNATILVF